MLNVADAMQKAVDATGLDDFGPPTFMAGLGRLIDSLNDEAALSDLGALMAEQAVHEPLSNRLRINAWCRDNPEASNGRVERPIVIVGMSRSGTTLLSHLLGKDPALRSLLRFEALSSVPPPEPDTWRTDPRYLESVQADEMSELVFPGLRAIHHDPPDAPVECNTLLAHEFTSTVFTTVYHVPDYLEWLASADLTDAYAYHERILTLLQSRWPGRWNLKTPQHALALDALRKRYPDATLIVTHRDPAVCATSTASLMSLLHGHTSSAARPVELGAMTAAFIEACADGLVADHRSHRGDDRMIDVHYPKLIEDPISTVRRLYEQMGTELTSSVEAEMVRHTRCRPQHQHGVHRYSATDFGLDVGELGDRYRVYRETFGVDVERSSRR